MSTTDVTVPPTLASPLASPSCVVDALATIATDLGALTRGARLRHPEPRNGTGLDARNVPPRLAVPQFNDFLEHLST